MAKRNNVKISYIAVIRIIVFLFIGFVLFSAYVNTMEFVTKSPLFEIKEVQIDKSIAFIDVRALKDLKGMNIFRIDIKKIDKQIAKQYPYIASLRVVRQLPDTVLVLAKKREPLMQIYFKKKYLLLDTEGVALYYTLQPAALPLVYGVPLERNGIFLGGAVKGPEMAKVLEILNGFKASKRLERWRIHTIQAGNLSKIDLSVGETMHVLFDQDDDIQDKIELLQMLVSTNKINLNKVRYIDLRFKEPVIADNLEDK
ncbi:MAG: FtsQ-type POTRA domain-containing protein [Candidatus Omnitrophica bacterium]|nr:FtsQ-type POTRA domain-containing protein [Candidatus Omnitrophota bacterium]